MNVPKNLKYTRTHEWVEYTGAATARVGVTDHAQHELGDLVFINLPEVGESVKKEKSFADVESVKAVSEIFSPFTGTVSAVNEELLDHPEKVNAEPYEAWLAEISDITDESELLDAEEYEKICAEGE